MSVTDEILVTPEVLACPYDFYRRVRDEAPVHRTPLGFWLVSRYEDVLAVVRDPERFSSHTGGAISGSRDPSPELREIAAQGYPPVDTLLTNDPPDHTRFRSLVNQAFTPKRVAQLEDEISQIATQLLDAWIGDGQVELVSQLAVPLPLTVIADALGVDRADMADFKRWSDAAVAPLSGLLTEEQLLECARSRVEMHRYLVARCDERRAERRDDLLSDLVHATFEDGPRAGEHLTTPELMNVVEQLLVAGNETTTKLIAAGTLLLIEHPDQQAAVRADRSLVPNLVEEALRLESPVQMLPRRTTVDVRIGDVDIPAGEIVMVMYGCANRDEAKYPEADRFDVQRANARTHLAFGQGPHFCVGAALARSEARIAFDLLLDRLDDIALAPIGEPTERELSMTLRGLSALHLTFRPTGGAA